MIGQVIVGGEMFGGDILSLVLQLYTIGFVTNAQIIVLIARSVKNVRVLNPLANII